MVLVVAWTLKLCRIIAFYRDWTIILPTVGGFRYDRSDGDNDCVDRVQDVAGTIRDDQMRSRIVCNVTHTIPLSSLHSCIILP